ncbi:MAG TPA: hypothetical protein VN709_06860 [Terriglobales bacterium]|nr:hypothetical protein [Terriglobales bacterium]
MVTRLATVIGFAWLAATLGAQAGPTFPLLDSVITLRSAVSLAEYARLDPALPRESEDETESRTLADVAATRIQLGTLGDGFLFSGTSRCGATGNCPMVLLYPKPGGGYQALDAGGYGMVTTADPKGAPELFFFWNMSAMTGTIARFHYNGTSYVADGGEDYRVLDENGTMAPVADNGQPTFPIPRDQSHWGVASLAPSEYAALRPLLLAALAPRLGAAGARAAFEHSRASSFDGDTGNGIAVVQTPDCDRLGNCVMLLFQETATRGGTGSVFTAARYKALGSALRGWGIAVALQETTYRNRGLGSSLQVTLALRTASGFNLQHLVEVPADRIGQMRWLPDQCATASGAVRADADGLRAAHVSAVGACIVK